MTNVIKGKIHSFQSLGTVDGPGIRFVAFFQGCPLRCGCCHNPDTWNNLNGEQKTVEQLFSKIKMNPNYHPDKATAMRLCVGARLNLDETKDLLARAGYALSPCDKRDIIFSFFIEREVYDMIEIDIALEEHGLPCFIE